MSAGLRLTGYAVVLGLALGGGVALGAAVGPEPDATRRAVTHGGHADDNPAPEQPVEHDDDLQDE